MSAPASTATSLTATNTTGGAIAPPAIEPSPQTLVQAAKLAIEPLCLTITVRQRAVVLFLERTLKQRSVY